MRIAATILILTAAAALASPWQMVIARKKANAGGASDYLTDLAHRWEGNDLTDSVGSADLTAYGWAHVTNGVFVFPTGGPDNHEFTASDTTLAGRTNWTFTAWVKQTNAVAADAILMGFDAPGGSESAIWIDNATTDTLTFRIEDGAQDTGTMLGTDAWPVGDWAFVAVSCTGGGDIFSVLDDAVQATYTGGAVDFIADTSDALYLGGRGGSVFNTVVGYMDDIRIYSAALTTGQIQQVRSAYTPSDP